MRRIRFSLATLMGGIAVVGLCVAALKNPSILWNSLFFTVTGFALVVSTLCAVNGTGTKRAFWLGFSAVGWGHFLLGFWGNERPYLLTDYAVKEVQERLIGRSDSGMGGGILDLDGIRRQIVLSVLTLLIALAGGYVTARVAAARGGKR